MLGAVQSLAQINDYEHAGGQRTDGQLHEWVRRRVELGIAVKRDQGGDGAMQLTAVSRSVLRSERASIGACFDVDTLQLQDDGKMTRHAADSPSTPIVCLGGGTPHKPPVLQPSGFVLHEGTELADYLRSQVKHDGCV